MALAPTNSNLVGVVFFSFSSPSCRGLKVILAGIRRASDGNWYHNIAGGGERRLKGLELQGVSPSLKPLDAEYMLFVVRREEVLARPPVGFISTIFSEVDAEKMVLCSEEECESKRKDDIWKRFTVKKKR